MHTVITKYAFNVSVCVIDENHCKYSKNGTQILKQGARNSVIYGLVHYIHH